MFLPLKMRVKLLKDVLLKEALVRDALIISTSIKSFKGGELSNSAIILPGY